MSLDPKTVKMLTGRTVVLGVGGGIAAYKAAELVRLLRKAGADVRVVMTAAAQAFMTPLTLQTLSGHPVGTELFDLTQESQIGHIALADRADLLLIAPATADLLARLSLGLADDLLTTLALACRARVCVAPAMNVNMWQKPQVQEHVARLRSRGVEICGPEPGELACGWVGEGRMSEPQALVEYVGRLLDCGDEKLGARLGGRRVVIAAGPTYEALDPVRFLGNRSSGKMGFALAREAARRGAEVTLVAGPVALSTPPGVRRVDVESAAEMAEAVLPAVAPDAADIIVMAAAVCDYRPAQVAAHKLKKVTLGEQPVIPLIPTEDILAELGRRRGQRRTPLLVGFAAETHDVEAYALRKLREKRCDVIVANDVAEPGSGFGTDTNRVTLITAPGQEPQPDGLPDQLPDERPDAPPAPQIERLPQLPKDEVASQIWDRLAQKLAQVAARRV